MPTRNDALALIRGLLFEPSADHWRQICQLTAFWQDAAFARELLSYLTEHLDASWPDRLRAAPREWLVRWLAGEDEPRLGLVRALDLSGVLGWNHGEALTRALERDWGPLAALDLRGSALSEAHVDLICDNPSFRTIEALDLGFCDLDADLLGYLVSRARFEDLHELGLAASYAAPALERLSRAFPDLRALDVSFWCDLPEVVFVQGLPWLRELDMSFSRVTAPVLRTLGGRGAHLHDLRVLRMAGTPLRDADLPVLHLVRDLPSLRELDLRYACLTDGFWDAVDRRDYASLDVLRLDGNYMPAGFVRRLPSLFAFNPLLSQHLAAHPPRPREPSERELGGDGPVRTLTRLRSRTRASRLQPIRTVDDVVADIIDEHGLLQDVPAFRAALAFQHGVVWNINDPATLPSRARRHATIASVEADADLLPFSTAASCFADLRFTVHTRTADLAPLSGEAEYPLYAAHFEAVPLDDALTRDLIDNPTFLEISGLGLTRCDLGDGEGLHTLAASTFWEGLNLLVLESLDATPAAWEALGRHLSQAPLSTLAILDCPTLDDAALAALVARGVPAGIRNLAIRGCPVGPDGLRDLLHAHGLRRLSALDLSGTPVGEAATHELRRLAERLGPDWEGLRSLTLEGCGLDPRDIEALASGPLMAARVGG